MKERDPIVIKEVEAAIFDLDGVITDTANVHAKAWKEMFDTYFQHEHENQAPMDLKNDYAKYLDGKPRYDGVKSFLESRAIELPMGEPSDAPEEKTYCGLGNKKNEIFQKLLGENQFEVYKDAVERIRKWKNEGVKTAIISSSKNCKKILDQANLNDLFDLRIDGSIAEKENITGKPAPDIFLEAAKRLKVDVDRAVVFEDAISGVQAGASGKFLQTIGIARTGDGSDLLENGADQVIRDMFDIDIQTECKPKHMYFSSMTSALDHYQEMANQLSNKKLALFLDYDGTLTPIVKNPKDATLDKEMKELMEELGKNCHLAVVSGRDLQDVKSMVGLENIYYAGCHGFDIEGPDLRKEIGEDALGQIEQAEEDVRELLKPFDGAALERKRFVVAAHYRNAEKHGDEVVKGMNAIAEKYDRLKLVENKMVAEIRPNFDWDKGKAIDAVLQEWDQFDEELLPVFIGDDTTDEDGFAYLREKGIGILVGDHGKPSYARYKLEDHHEVKKFFHQLNDIVSDSSPHAWKVVYGKYAPNEQSLREALSTLGNGYFCTRGAAEEVDDEGVHYPGTYLAGGYNRASTEVSGRMIENEDLVNWPNWLPLTFKIENGEWFHIDKVQLLDYQQILDLRCGVLERRMQFLDPSGEKETELITKRFVSQNDHHYAGIKWYLKPINYSGNLSVKTGLDGSTFNNGVARYRQLEGHHTEVLELGKEGEKGMFLLSQSIQSKIYMALTAMTEVYQNGKNLTAERETHISENKVEQVITFHADKLVPITVEKKVCLYSSQDVAVTDPLLEAKNNIYRGGNFKDLLLRHKMSWKHLWNKFDILIEGSKKNQMLLRLHLFHLLQTVSPKSIHLDVGVPARGWHGEAYRGHIFWDEIYIFPLINLRMPEITRALLLYRYRRLKEARENALESGFKGAMYPWQCSSNGREESQQVHLNPKSGQWVADNTYLQRHISASIVYNIVHYYEATGDNEFLSNYGAEMILDIANFFSSLAEWSHEKERYVVKGVAGPDEYHTAYPNSDKNGVDNNAYTNVMITWVLMTGLKTLDRLENIRKEELMERLEIDAGRINLWEKVSKMMYVPFVGDHTIEQFEGYDQLPELDWPKYKEKYGEFLRLDRILQAEGDDVNNYKASKQADVLMLFYLFDREQLKGIFKHLGYPFSEETIEKSITYYDQRTSHGSTLSQLVNSWVMASMNRQKSWESFEKALVSDFEDVQGGTTAEGIHLGAMAGTADLIQRCYSGISIRDEALIFNPQLPENLQKISLKVRFRSKWLDVNIDSDKLKVYVLDGYGDGLQIGFKDELHKVDVGDRLEFDL